MRFLDSLPSGVMMDSTACSPWLRAFRARRLNTYSTPRSKYSNTNTWNENRNWTWNKKRINQFAKITRKHS